jgi:hypothetical protein
MSSGPSSGCLWVCQACLGRVQPRGASSVPPALLPGEAAEQNLCRGHAGAAARVACGTQWHPPRGRRAVGSQSESAVLTMQEALMSEGSGAQSARTLGTHAEQMEGVLRATQQTQQPVAPTRRVSTRERPRGWREPAPVVPPPPASSAPMPAWSGAPSWSVPDFQARIERRTWACCRLCCSLASSQPSRFRALACCALLDPLKEGYGCVES